MQCVNEGIIKVSPFCTLVVSEFKWLPSFYFFSFCHIWKHFLLKYSGYFVSDLHALLDRGNLCHSGVWYILCCLLVVFVSTVTWDFLAALLVHCTSELVCLPFLQTFLIGFGICTLCLFCSCYILPLFSVFNLSSFSSAYVWF